MAIPTPIPMAIFSIATPMTTPTASPTPKLTGLHISKT